MPIRPLLLVAALAGGDYLLWTWSSDGDSTTVALISGLALAPLILALIWLVSLGVARTAIAKAASPQAARPARTRFRRGPLRRLVQADRHSGAVRSQSADERWEDEETPHTASERRRASEKIAA